MKLQNTKYPVRIVSSSRMRSLENMAINQFHISAQTLMESAAYGVMQRVLHQDPQQVTVLCGPGNNGGDGLACARLLAARGIIVNVVMLFPENQLNSLCLMQYHWAKTYPIQFATTDKLTEFVAQSDVVIDAIFGTGVRSILDANLQNSITTINELASYIIAVDLPSGLCNECTTTIIAHETVTFQSLKEEMTQFPGRHRCGEIFVHDIGIPNDFFTHEDGYYFDSRWMSAHFSQYQPDEGTSHKGTFGHLLLWGGETGKQGALYLATLAAYRSGVGLITALCESGHLPLYHEPLPPEVITAQINSPTQLMSLVNNKNAFCIGPGLGTQPQVKKLFLDSLLHLCLPVVLDADALNILAESDNHMLTLPHNTILTPHPKEMGRLLKMPVETIQNNRIQICREAARRWQATVVLKGAHTVIAHPDGRWGVNSSGGRELAKGGTGDVLSGIIGAFLCRGMDTFVAASLAVFIHGQAGHIAAARSSDESVLASEVANAIAQVLKTSKTKK